MLKNEPEVAPPDFAAIARKFNGHSGELTCASYSLCLDCDQLVDLLKEVAAQPSREARAADELIELCALELDKNAASWHKSIGLDRDAEIMEDAFQEASAEVRALKGRYRLAECPLPAKWRNVGSDDAGGGYEEGCRDQLQNCADELETWLREQKPLTSKTAHLSLGTLEGQ